MNYKISILYRYNNFFTDLNEFITVNGLHEYDLTIYNCTNEDIEHANIIKTDEKIETIIKSIYQDNTDPCIILDSCIKYIDFDIEDAIKQPKSYCLIKHRDFTLPVILSKTPDINNTDILLDYSTDYEDHINCEGRIDSKFYTNFFNTLNVPNLIFATILEQNVNNVEDYRLNEEKSKVFFKIFKLYHTVTYTEELITNILSNSNTDLHIVWTLLTKILKHKPPSKEIIEILNCNLHKYSAITPFIIFNNYDIYMIYEYIINYFLKDPLFMISDVPNGILSGHNKDIYKYYPNIGKHETEISLPLLLEEDVILKDPATVNISGNNIDIDISDKAFLYRGKQILLVESVSPLNFRKYGEDKILISYSGHLNYKNYVLKGQFVKFNKFLIGLMRVENGSYKLIILNHHTLKLEQITKNFITKHEPISLYNYEEELYIITRTDTGQIFKCKLDLDTLIIDIFLKNAIISSSPFSFNIEQKKSIGVKIIGFDLPSKHLYKNYSFYNLPTNQKYFLNATFNPKQKLLELDDQVLYINNLLFLSNGVGSSVEKTATAFFHKSSKNTELYTKCVELQIPISNAYNECKYYIILQEAFEKLNCLEISDIISSKCLIISLIDEQMLSQNKITGNYTTNESLVKLFLINIVTNTSYVQFIFDKLIHSKEYSKRHSFMEVDIQNIATENNIYDCILESINKKTIFDTDLNNKDDELLKIIKSKILKGIPENIYKSVLNIVTFIIHNNYNIAIGFIDIDNNFIEENQYKNILSVLFKINWLGKIDFNVNSNSDVKYNLYIMKNRSCFGLSYFAKNTLLYLIEENLLLKI